jgi:hypothetical protein
MSLRLPKLLDLAELARADASLLPNHLGTVDRKLREHLAERKSLLTALADSNEVDLVADLQRDRAAIEHALTAYSPDAWRCLKHGECFGGQCIYAAAPAAPADPAIPPEVMEALDRMSEPLHSSWGAVGDGSATAAADARCMKVIRDYIMRGAAATGPAITQALNVHLLWRDACEEWGKAVGGPHEYEIFAEKLLSAASAPKEPTEPVPAQPTEAVQRLAAEQFQLPPAKVQAYADTNGLPTADVKACESCPTCGAPVTVFQPKVGEPIYTHNPAAGVPAGVECQAKAAELRCHWPACSCAPGVALPQNPEQKGGA